MKCTLCGKETERKANVKKYCPECARERKRKYQREYDGRPEVKERRRKYKREYDGRPEVKERRRKYQREYQRRPEVKEYYREYNRRPEVKERKMLQPCLPFNIVAGTRILERLREQPEERERFLLYVRIRATECEYEELKRVHEKMKVIE